MTKGDKIKLRAELAGKAMQGVLSGGLAYDSIIEVSSEEGIDLPEAIAAFSVAHADALMKELGLDKE